MSEELGPAQAAQRDDVAAADEPADAGRAREVQETIDAERERITDLPLEVAVALYGSIEAKRHTLDTMMWQTPALGLVAQSFLLVVALGRDYSWPARLIAATLGIVAAMASIQLLLKHRYHEFLHAHWLEKFASAARLPGASPGRVVRLAFEKHDHPWRLPPQPDEDEERDGRDVPLRRRSWHRVRRWLVKPSSVAVWTMALAFFGAAQASVFLLGLIELLGGEALL